MRTDPNNPQGVAPSPDGIIRDRKWWIAILMVSNEITVRHPHLQTPEAQCVNGIWFRYPYRVKVK